MTQLSPVQDKLLTNVSNKLSPSGYVSEQILTPMSVKNSTGKIGTYGKGSLRIVSTLMGGKGKAKSTDVVVRSTDSYAVERHGLAGTLSPDDFQNVEMPFNARSDEVEALTELLWSDKEKALADALTSTATMTNNVTLSGTSQFSDYTNSDPLTRFSTARTTIRSAIGMPPNAAVMDWAVAEKLRYHPGILEALGFKDNRKGALSNQELASAMAVDRLLIANGVYNSAVLGQTDSVAALWGKHIVFFYAPASPMKKQQTLGYNVTFSGRGPRKVFRNKVTNPPESEEIIVVDDYDQLLIDVTAGWLIKDAIA